MKTITKKELKAKLLELLMKHEISFQQMEYVLKAGYPHPAIIIYSNKEQSDEIPKPEIMEVYEKIGHPVKVISFKTV